MNATVVEARTILTPTHGRGFLGGTYTHSLNTNVGCAYANAACGVYCYAQHLPQRRGREWGSFMDTKSPESVVRAYRRQRASLSRRGEPLRIYMSSVTDPYVPQERVVETLPRLYDAMIADPPDALVVQTRSPLITRDVDRLVALADACHLVVNVTVETDTDPLPIPGLERHATPIASRIGALATLRAAGVPTQAVVSPLLPVADVETFLETLFSVADRLVIAHYAIGDGSGSGARRQVTGMPELLVAAGYEYWARVQALDDVVATASQMAPGRVLRSKAGFSDLRPFHPTHHAVANRRAEPDLTLF